MKINAKAYARAGLLGNPSDGYFGKIVAVAVKNFSAEVVLETSPRLRIIPDPDDENVYADIHDFAGRIDLYGYYGGVRLIKAAVKTFYEYCRKQGFFLSEANYTIQYKTNIPRQLGLGGSSAIVTAAFRGLMEFYDMEIPREILPSLILEAERDELGISAGFMDRVIQVYEGCVYMDLDARMIEKKGYGIYQELDLALLPPLYLAYNSSLGKVSGSVLNDIRVGYEKKDPFVLKTIKRIARLAELGKEALSAGDRENLKGLMDENFDLRSQIMRITKDNRDLVETARACGASAKFAGSGGSIIGIYTDENMFQHLVRELGKKGAVVIRPTI